MVKEVKAVTAFLKSVAKKAGYLAVAIILILAVIICLSPLLSPVLDKKRTEFEKWASQFLSMPVTIHDVQLSWYRYQPEISLNKVTIVNNDTHQPALHVQKVSVFFSIPKSLWQRQLVPTGIMLTGTNVKIKKTEKGELQLDGFPTMSNAYQNQSSATLALAWILEQPRLILRDVAIVYDEVKGKEYNTKLHYLNIKNSHSKHIIEGSGVLYQKIPTDISLSIEWQGNKLDLSEIKAKGYVYITGFSLPQWLKEYEWQGWKINKGIASAKIWGTWRRGKFRKLQSYIQLYDLDLYSQTSKTLHKINRLSGNVGWKRENKKYILAGEDILIDLPQRLWPVTDFYLAFSRDANGRLFPTTANVGYLELRDVYPYLRDTSSLLSEHIQAMLAELQLKGSLQNSTIMFPNQLTDWQHYSFSTRFNHLSFLPRQNWPGIKNFSGTCKWNGQLGEISLNSSRSEFQYDAAFANKLNLEQLTGSIQFQQNKTNAWLFTIPSLQLLNSDTAANVSGTFSLPETGKMIADIKANFILQNANRVTEYLPLKTFSPDLVKWLKDAFVSGEVKDGHVELHGPLGDFPFDDNKGTFLISGAVNNLDFQYAPDWPMIKHIFGKLTFSGRKIVIDIDNAQIQDMPINNVHGVIPYLGEEKESILYVESKNIQTDFTNGLKFIHASPLEKTIGKMFANVTLSGPINLGLNLKVPLSAPDKTEVSGTIDMKDAVLNLVPWNINLDHLNGSIFFTEKLTQAKMISGLLFNKPLRLSLATIPKTKDLSIVRASFNNHLAIKDLEEWLKLPLSQIVEGSTDVSGDIDFSLKAPIEMHLRSNLVGLKINLPDEYGKKSEESKVFSTDLTIAEKSPLRIKLSYGDLLSAAVLLDKKENKYDLMSVNLHFGPGSVSWPQSTGLYITGNFATLDTGKIKKYMDKKSGSDFSKLTFRSADIEVQTLNLFGQELKQVHLQASPEKDNWNVIINSPDIVGQLKVPMNVTQQSTITAQFQKLYLNVGNFSKESTEINVKSLPSIVFAANNVRYNNIPLGQFAFRALSKGNVFTIQSLRILSPLIDLQSTGDWINNGNTHETHLKGRASSTRVSELLNSFGMDVHNFVASKGQLDFNFTWQNAPYAPTLASLNGQAKLNLGAGRIVDVGQSSAQMGLGRMLSIFSLQSIPRRLSLDFSDIFQKGYSFDSMHGDFTFQNGNAYTKNLRIDGPVASVGIDGRIGLKNKDYHFILSVTAYVTSSLPLAATLLTGNPLIGLGAFAVNTMIGSQVTTYYYKVTGPWNNPLWQTISK